MSFIDFSIGDMQFTDYLSKNSSNGHPDKCYWKYSNELGITGNYDTFKPCLSSCSIDPPQLIYRDLRPAKPTKEYIDNMLAEALEKTHINNPYPKVVVTLKKCFSLWKKTFTTRKLRTRLRLKIKNNKK